MDKLAAAVRNEWEMAWLKPKNYIFLALTAFMSPVIGWLILRMNDTAGIMPLLPNQLPMASLFILVNLYLPLILFMLAAEGFTFQPQRLKAFFLRPVHRYKLFLGKTAAIGGIMALHLAVGFVTSFVTGWILEGEAGPWGSQLLAYVGSLLPLLMWTVISAFAAQWFKSAAVAQALLILIYAAMALASFLFPHTWAAVSPTQYHAWYEAGAHAGGIKLFGFLYLISGIVLFFILGMGKFERRPL
ncbi:ABC transporter permease [Gorillibacterium sp. sgz5001074]|uniref:ABC transporter permease n=1 Tax=Gorillibacterium sp. sgz5001074 TaxID=3446695 RepID=UPI003F67CE3D